MSDYYMPPSSRARERERDTRDKDRDWGGGGGQGEGSSSVSSPAFVKRESTWRPKSQQKSRPANAWAARDSPRDSPGPSTSRKADAYYEPLRASDRDDRDRDSRDRDWDRDRERDRDVEGDADADRRRERERDRDRDVRDARDTRRGGGVGRKKEDDRGGWAEYHRRRRGSPAARRDDDRDRDRDRDRRWGRDRADDRGRADSRDRDRDRDKDRDRERNRWARSPSRSRNATPPRRGAIRRESPDYDVGHHTDSDSDDELDRRRTPPRRRSPSPLPRRRSASPPPRRRSPTPEKRRLASPPLPEPKRARDWSPVRSPSPPPRRDRSPPRGRSPLRDRSPSPPPRSRTPLRDRSLTRSPSPRRSPLRNGRDRRVRSPDTPPRAYGPRSRWGAGGGGGGGGGQGGSDRWQPQPRGRFSRPWGAQPDEPVKFRKWGPPSPSPPHRGSPPLSPRRDTPPRTRSSSRSPERDDHSAPRSAVRSPRRVDSRPSSPPRSGVAARDGTNGNLPRTTNRNWRPAPTGPAAHRQRNGSPPQRDAREMDMDVDDDERTPRRSDKWSPIKRAAVPPPSGSVSATASAASAHSGPASGSGTPRAPDEFLDRIADKQQQYDRHLSTIAPYISAAFAQWYAQNATPGLHQFLVHYFGREPSRIELDQIQQLLQMRTQLGRDQQELRHLHAQAVRTEAPTPGGAPPPPSAPTGPRAAREREARMSQRAPSSASRTPTSETPRPHRSRAAPGEAYERLAQVGEGTYGKVYKARNVFDGSLVALKRIRMEQEKDGFPVTSMREIKLLQALHHPNVVRLKEMMVSKGTVFMVLEYMNHDLTGILCHPEVKLSAANIKSLNYQMLSGLGYLHRRGILHRDMKGSNILLNGEGELKLADFGLARWYHKHKRDDYTNRVITLWYRSPELLMGETAYGPEVDTWSAGCIMLEIFTGKQTFQGQDEISQLDAIWAVMGTPDEADWPGIHELPWYELVKPRQALPSRFRDVFAKWMSPAAMDVVEGLLAFNPTKRLLADAALETAYFTTEDPPMEAPTQLAACGEHHEMTVKMLRRREGK